MTLITSLPISGRKIPENPQAGPLTGDEVLPIVQDSVTKYAKISDIVLIVLAAISPTSNKTRLGITKLSVNPAVNSNPIAIGTNDPRVSTTGVTEGAYGGQGKGLEIAVDVYGKVTAIRATDLEILASEITGLSEFIQNIGDIKYILNTQSSTLSVWIETRVYKTNEFVLKNKKLFRSLVNGNNFVPGENELKWETIITNNSYTQFKTTIPGIVNFSINWQTDLVPNSAITYAQKHGNNIGAITGVFDAGGGVMTPYSPNYTYTANLDGSINVISFTEVFGTVTII
jgi:hypothetical protein